MQLCAPGGCGHLRYRVARNVAPKPVSGSTGGWHGLADGEEWPHICEVGSDFTQRHARAHEVTCSSNTARAPAEMFWRLSCSRMFCGPYAMVLPRVKSHSKSLNAL
eukprot:2373783-Amphidinium_carterae.2